MKKLFFAITFALTLGCILCSCSTDAQQEKSLYAQEKSLYTQGLEVIALMDEMVKNESYIGAYSTSEEIFAITKELAGNDYSCPAAVYALSFPDEALSSLAELSELENASAELNRSLKAKLSSALITQINARSGVSALAAAAICTSGKTFVNHEADGNVTYLYTYRDAAPVAITFIPGEDFAVSATGSFILSDSFSYGSAEEIRSFFGEAMVDVELITE